MFINIFRFPILGNIRCFIITLSKKKKITGGTKPSGLRLTILNITEPQTNRFHFCTSGGRQRKARPAGTNARLSIRLRRKLMENRSSAGTIGATTAAQTTLQTRRGSELIVGLAGCWLYIDSPMSPPLFPLDSREVRIEVEKMKRRLGRWISQSR